MEFLKLFDIEQILAQIITFLILFFVLRRFTWKPILKLLDDRKEKISSEFKKAEDLQKDAQRTKAEYEAKILAIDDQARIRFAQAVEEARDEADEIRKKASEDAQRMIDIAKVTIEKQVQEAQEKIKAEIVDLALRAAEDVIEEKLTESQDRKIIEEFLKNIDQMKQPGA